LLRCWESKEARRQSKSITGGLMASKQRMGFGKQGTPISRFDVCHLIFSGP
jgi:hypothetical protein